MNEEQELVAQVVNGNPEAEEKFIKLFRPRLLRASMYFLGGQDCDAENIVQDTLIIALPKLKDYIFKAPIYSWLRQICLRLCYAHLRKRGRLLMSAEEDLEIFMRRIAAERFLSDNLKEQKQEQMALLNELKEKLNPDSSQIVELRQVQGMSYIQISQALKIPMGTVISRLARAKDQLQQLLESPAIQPGNLTLALA